MENKIDPAISGGRDKVRARKTRILSADLEKVISHDVDREWRIKSELPGKIHLNAKKVAKRIGRPNIAPSMSPAGEAGFARYSNKPNIIQKEPQTIPKT